jgi:hypothetical protein
VIRSDNQQRNCHLNIVYHGPNRQASSLEQL